MTTFAILEYDEAMDAHFVPPIKPWSEWRLRLARWLLRCDQDAARTRLRDAIARSGQPDSAADFGMGHETYSWWTPPTGEDAVAFERIVGKPIALIHQHTGVFALSHGDAAPATGQLTVTHTPYIQHDLHGEGQP